MSSDPTCESRRILVVDDSAVQLRVIRAALEKAGFRVVEATNGAEGLLRIAEQPFDLVVSDCHMPLMDGYQLCRLVKDDPATRDLPVILLTGEQNRLSRFWARTCGADLFLTKGHGLGDLVGTVSRMAQKPSEPSPLVGVSSKPPEQGLDAIQRRLAKALERRLLATTLGQAVAELRTQLENPDAMGWSFLALMEDLVLPGALYLLSPSPRGPRAQVVASEDLDERTLDRLLANLRSDPLAVGQHLRLEVLRREPEGTLPRTPQHVAFELPVAGGGFHGRWGILLESVDFQAHQDLFNVADREFQQVFNAMVTLDYLADANRRLLKADQARAEFVNTIIHEIRNPLAATSSALRMLTKQWTDGHLEHVGELLAISQRSVERLLRISNSVLDLEKLESGQFVLNPVSTDLAALVAGSLEELRTLGVPRGVTLVLEPLPSYLPKTRVDPDRASQCLVNLVSNAIQHSPEGGAVTVRILPRSNGLDVEVEDQGPGVPPLFRERLFQKFQQAEGGNKGGTGLGLAITHGLMTAMGGSVEYHGETGQPTMFVLRFPVDGRM